MTRSAIDVPRSRQQNENARLVAEFERLRTTCVGLQSSEPPKVIPHERGDRVPSRETLCEQDLLCEQDQATRLQVRMDHCRRCFFRQKSLPVQLFEGRSWGTLCTFVFVRRFKTNEAGNTHSGP